MKKVILFLSVVLLLGMFYACSKSDDVTDNVEGQNSRSNSDDNNITAYNGEDESRGELICPIEEGTDYVEISEFFQSSYYHYQGTEFRNFFEGSCKDFIGSSFLSVISPEHSGIKKVQLDITEAPFIDNRIHY